MAQLACNSAESVLDQFRASLAAFGIKPPPALAPDSKFHPADVARSGGKDLGAVFLSADRPVGAYVRWDDGRGLTVWTPEAPPGQPPPTPAESFELELEVMEARRQYSLLASARYEEARIEAPTIWSKAVPAGCDHPIIKEVGEIAEHNVRAVGKRLVLRVADAIDRLHGLYLFDDSNGGWFLPGSQWRGHFHLMGRPEGSKPVAICADLLTALVVRSATTWPVAVAFLPENLSAVATAMWNRWRLRVVVCQDPGDTDADVAAKRAAGAARGRCLAPPPGSAGWLDFSKAHGLLAAGAVLRDAARGRSI